MEIDQPISALILGAGLSRRFGGDKLCADLGGRPLIQHVAESVQATMNALGVKDIRLVVPPGFPVSMLPDIPTVTAPDHARGIAHSLRAGLTAQGEESAAVLIFLADMPFPPPPALIGQMVSQLPNFGSVRPTWQGKPGHPVLVSRSLWPAIIEMDGDRGAQAVLDRGTSVHVESVDDGVIFDIDRPADLREARRRLQKLRDAGG